MRIVLEQNKQKEFLRAAIIISKEKNIKEFAKSISVSKSTLEKWLNEKRLIPKNIFDGLIIKYHQLDLYKKFILNIKPDNWGQIIGGKKTYKIILERYGKEEIKRRQIIGGKSSLLIREKIRLNNFKINIESHLFLELYGALLGDGWLSVLSYNYKNKRNLWWVGISGHVLLDKNYLMYLKNIINKILKQKVIIKYKKNVKAMEILFCNKPFIIFLNQKMKFPIGIKDNLKIEESIAREWNKIKYVIRGVFDTDGCFYFDKTPAKKPYPCISIHMKAPILLEQINKQLLSQNFKVMFRKDRLVLKGSKQIEKWMSEIGSSNQKHFNKYNIWKKSL